MRFSHLLVLFLLLLLALGLTFPLVTHLVTHVPGTDTWAYDEYTFLWSMWWFKHSLLDLHSSPLVTDLLFFPLGLDLILYTYNLLGAILALPLQVAGNVPLASNLVNLLATVLSGYGTFLLARYLLGRRDRSWPAPAVGLARDGAALLAGLIFAFSSNRAIYLALGHYNIFGTQWVPFFALYLLRARRGLDGKGWIREAPLAGLFAGLALLTDMLYGVLLALLALVIILATSRSATGGREGRWGRLVASLGVMALVAALASAPLLLPTLREGLSGTYALEGWGDAQKLSSDLVGLVTPTALHPTWGTEWEAELRAVQTGDSRFSDVNTLFLGYGTLALALLGALVGRRRVRPWVALALVAGLLSLGPVLQVNGRSTFDLDGLSVNVPLPFIVTHYLPFIQGYRAPNRFSILLMLALAVLAAYGTSWLIERLLAWPGWARSERSRLGRGGRVAAGGLALLLALVLIFEHLAWPLPLTDARVPALYQQVAAQPDDLTVMQLPTGWRNGFRVFGSEDTRVQWYQSVHGRPIISGNAVRNPPFKFEYFERLPLLQALVGLEMYQPPDPEVDRQARESVDDLMALWNVGYLVVNPPVPGRYPYADTWQAVRDYALDVLPVDPQPVWDSDGMQVYAVRRPLVPLPFSLDLGSQETSAYRGEGWSFDEPDIGGATAIWALGREAELYLPLRDPPAPSLQLALRVQPFSYSQAPTQALSVELNDVDLGTQILAGGWQELTFPMPAEAVRHGLNRFRLRFAHSARPFDVLPGQGEIGSTGQRSPVDIEINSGGLAQDLAYITVGGPDGSLQDASAGGRGYNLAVLDPKQGRVLSVRGFDTRANALEAERLARFVEDLPQGVIVVAASRDDASRLLTDEAVAALAVLGSNVDLRRTPGAGHALIGIKGARPGTAAEVVDSRGAYLRLAADRRPLALAVDWVRVEGTP